MLISINNTSKDIQSQFYKVVKVNLLSYLSFHLSKIHSKISTLRINITKVNKKELDNLSKMGIKTRDYHKYKTVIYLNKDLKFILTTTVEKIGEDIIHMIAKALIFDCDKSKISK